MVTVEVYLCTEPGGTLLCCLDTPVAWFMPGLWFMLSSCVWAVFDPSIFGIKLNRLPEKDYSFQYNE